MSSRQDPVPSGFSSSDVLIPLADEYDPMFPNDYEKVMKRHREERQRQREQERQKEIEEREKYGVAGAAQTGGLMIGYHLSSDSRQEEERQARGRRSQRLLPFPCSRGRVGRRR